jgi:hypothetical protein
MNGEPVSKITCFGPVNMTVNAMNLFTSSWNVRL